MISANCPLDLCILIPCYNNLPGLIESVQSIRYQEGKYALVIVDDGSTPPLELSEIEQRVGTLVPLHLITLERNAGITAALNTGLSWILKHLEVRYVARLDCGDLCHEDRFYKQVAYLDAHPEAGLLGSWCTFRQPGTSFQYDYITPTEHAQILREMYFRNAFIHPTVLFRTALLKLVGLYPVAYPFVEDYALFWEILQVAKGKILNEVLVTCEINKAGISIKNRKAQLQGRKQVLKAYGNSTLLKGSGLGKLFLLELIPYQFIMKIKQKLTRS